MTPETTSKKWGTNELCWLFFEIVKIFLYDLNIKRKKDVQVTFDDSYINYVSQIDIFFNNFV